MVAGKNYRVDPSAPVPLILFPAPSITRETTLAALERAKRPWRIACVSGSLSGMQAAALAGLGVITIARGLLPAGLTELQGPHDLPSLGDIEFVLQGRAGRGPAAKLADAILANGTRLQSG
jgi:DNA-binding transcriptional LysR family regulator